MKKTVISGISALVLLASSCSDFAGQFGSGAGRISPSVGIDTEAVGDSDALSRAEFSDVTAQDLSITLTKYDGSYKHTWDKLADFPLEQAFTVGEYTMEAFYGDATDEGFEKPAFYGSQTLTVADGQTTSLALTAQMANAMFTVKYTDAFKKYMQSWSATFETANGSHTYDAEETRRLYVAPGSVTLKVNVKKANGLDATIEVAKLTAVARYDYTVTIDVNNGNVGDATLNVSFSENLSTEDVDIDLSEEIITTQAPQVTASGFNAGENVYVVAGNSTDEAVAMNIVAMGGLAEVNLHTKSTSLIADGWPEDINLLAATAEQQAKLTALGFECLGLWKKADKMAVATFTNVSKYIRPSAGDNDNVFTIIVKDKLSRVSQPLSLTLTVDDVHLELSAINEYFNPGEELKFNVLYNGSQLDKSMLTVEYLNAVTNKWREVEIKSIEAVGRALNTFAVTVVAPSIEENVTIRVRTKTAVSNEAEFKVSPFKIACTDGDTYATHAYVNVFGTEIVDGFDINQAKLYVKSGNGEFAQATATVQDGYFSVTGLNPGTANQIYLDFNGVKTRTITINTEAAIQFPNSNMENWYSELAPFYQTELFGAEAYRWFANAKGGEAYWATRNALTTATSEGPTPNYVSYSGTKSATGVTGYAAEISTIGYGKDSTFLGSGGTVKHTAAGMLFVGEHNATSETEETFNYGRPFASRPFAMSFSYKFAPYKEESFKIYIVLENRDNGVIQIGYGELVSGSAVSDFTKAKIDITYSNTTLKATHCYAVFISSTADSPAVQNVKGDKGLFDGYTDGRRIGSVLTIDDIELIY